MPNKIHASVVFFENCSVLIKGESGSGKSDLALRLIDHGAKLVADDQVNLKRDKGQILMSPSPLLAGLLEVRGLGIIKLPHQPNVTLSFIIQLNRQVERLPVNTTQTLLGIKIPTYNLNPFEASTVAKVRQICHITRDVVELLDNEAKLDGTNA